MIVDALLDFGVQLFSKTAIIQVLTKRSNTTPTVAAAQTMKIVVNLKAGQPGSETRCAGLCLTKRNQ